MSSTIAFQFVDVKANKKYHLKQGKQLIASVNYSGPEDADLTLPCDDSVAPFLVELSVKRQSARLTCLEGSCVAKSMGIGPGGTIKLKNGDTVEFGETNCLEMQFIILQDESQAHILDEVGQIKRVKRKLPETPGIPAQPPPKPARKFSGNDQLPPPKPQRTKAKSISAIIITPTVAEIKRKISKEVNMRKDLEDGSVEGSNKEVCVRVANSICYQLMLQPNSSDFITSKLIDAINSATKIMEQHMLTQMEEFLVTYRNYLGIQATPDCLLPADAPVIKHLLDALIRTLSMQEGIKEVCSVCVEVLVILCSSTQNCLTLMANEGIGTLIALIKMNTLQFCFELQCNCWKLLTIMMETMLYDEQDQPGNFTADVIEVSCSLARQQLFNFNTNCSLVCSITAYLVSAVTFCSKSSDSKLTSLFTTLQKDILQHVMGVSTAIKLNEQFKQHYSKLASLLAPDYSIPTTNAIVSELEASGDIPIVVHESFKKELDSYVATSLKKTSVPDFPKTSLSTSLKTFISTSPKTSVSTSLKTSAVSTSLKTSISTSVLEAHSKPRKTVCPSAIPEQVNDDSGHKSLSKSQSDSMMLSISRPEDSEPPNLSRSRKESKVKEHFYKHFALNSQQEPAKSSAGMTESQEQATDMVYQKEQPKLSTNIAESSGDVVDQQEQEKLPTDINDQEKQIKSSADMIDKQVHTKSSLDLVDQQEQEKSSTYISDQSQVSTARQMDMYSPYMSYTLKHRQHKDSAETSGSGRQSWSNNMSNFSHIPGTIKQFSKEQACIEEMMDAHEDVVAVLTTRIEAIDTLVPLWRNGKSLQAAINAEASCLNDDDTDMILFSDLLSLFKRYSSGWTLAVSLVFLRYFKQLLQNLTNPKYLQVIHDTLEMILERFTDIILSCKQSTVNDVKLSAQLDRQQKEMCYEELQEIQEIVTKELATKAQMKTSDDITQEALEHYRKLQKFLEPFRQPLD